MTKKPILQGGVQNYLGKQKEVKAPIKWKSSPDHPETELAYITKAEKDLLVKQDLHNSLKGGVNRGPSGIMSLNGFGSADPEQNVSGSQMSAAESGDFSGFSGTGGGGGPELPPGVDRKPSKTAQDIRSAFITAGGGRRVNPGFFDSRNTISPTELATARAYARRGDNPFARKAMYNRGGGLMGLFTSGGFLGNLIRGIGRSLGYGKNYNEPTYNMSQYNNLGLFSPSINPNNLDRYNEFVDDEENDNEPNIVSFDNPNNRLVPNVNLLAQPTYNSDGTVRPDAFDYLTNFGVNTGQFNDNNFGITKTGQFDDSPYGRINDEDMVP